MREPQEYLTADAKMAPLDVKTHRKYLRMVLLACLSAAFLGEGMHFGGAVEHVDHAPRALLAGDLDVARAADDRAR